MKIVYSGKSSDILAPTLRHLALALAVAGAITARTAPADLSRLVVVGDSLMAGYQNGSLCGSQQTHGMAALIARQASSELTLPLIADPGIPNALAILDPGPPLVISPLPGVSNGRIAPLSQPFDLAVPGQTVQEALTKRPDVPFDSMTDLVLGLPGLLGGVARSQVEWAEALHPSAIIVWIGNNDTLGAALAADASQVTPEDAFTAAYTELMQRLSATGAKLVVANLPDVTVVPYLTSAEEVAAKIGAPLGMISPVLGLNPGDYVIPEAQTFIEGILTGAISGPLPDNVVLTANEVAIIRNQTAKFNQVIAAQAKAHGAALVDINTFLNTLNKRGLVVHGRRLTTDYLGGIFSLDGIHPTNTGQAATANEFIKVLDKRFAAGIPPVNVEEISQEDPLLLPGVGHPARALVHLDEEMAGLVRASLGH